MWTVLKFVVPPAAAASVFIADLAQQAGLILNITALAVVFAGFFVVSKLRAERDAYKNQVGVHESAATAWRDERDAAVSRADRYQGEHQAMSDRIKVLEIELAETKARPDLAVISSKIDVLSAKMDHVTEMSTKEGE